MVTYQEALAAVFLEGYVTGILTVTVHTSNDCVSWIFLALSLLGLRQWLVRIIPESLVLAVGAGIGLLIA